MKIAVISDIHENFHNLIIALEDIQKQEAELILCLGDMMNAGVAKILAAQSIPVYLIWGNNDGEVVDVMRAAFRENSKLHVGLTTYEFLTFDDRSLFITHYDNLAIPMAKSGLYDAVFYGHTHLKNMDKEGQCWVVNPGELSAQKTGIASYALYNTSTNEVELIELKNTITLKSNKVDEYFRENMDKLNFRSKESFKI